MTSPKAERWTLSVERSSPGSTPPSGRGSACGRPRPLCAFPGSGKGWSDAHHRRFLGSEHSPARPALHRESGRGRPRSVETWRTWLALIVLLLLCLAPATRATSVILVVGAAGETEFGTNFVIQAAHWQNACQRAGLTPITVGLDSPAPDTTAPTNDLARLRGILEAQPKNGPDPLWLVLIGHGTFDGKEAKFNLRGPDLSDADLATALAPFQRPLAILDLSSSSGPFLPKLSRTNRVVIVATRSGAEQNYARIGQYLAETVADPQGDLDQDGQTSLLEAFLAASFRVAEFYKTEGRMATEHALLDDNGDRLGTPADWFRGLRATKRSKDGAALDGLRAHQFHLVPSPAEARLSDAARARRDALERSVAELREQRTKLPEAEYFTRLEPLLLELARLYDHPAGSPTE